jgi:hypothetical protein
MEALVLHVKSAALNNAAEEIEKKEKERRIAWLNDLESALESAQDEEFDVVPRSQEMREPLDLRY